MLENRVMKWMDQCGDASLLWAMKIVRGYDQVVMLSLTVIPGHDIRARGWRGTIDELIEMFAPVINDRLMPAVAVVTVPSMFYASAPDIDGLRRNVWRPGSGTLLVPYDTGESMFQAACGERLARYARHQRYAM